MLEEFEENSSSSLCVPMDSVFIKNISFMLLILLNIGNTSCCTDKVHAINKVFKGPYCICID
jgi:hypothetical protein